MKILFISHSYPPIWGGVESQNFNLAESLKRVAEVKVIANGKGKKYLPIFLPVSGGKVNAFHFSRGEYVRGEFSEETFDLDMASNLQAFSQNT